MRKQIVITLDYHEWEALNKNSYDNLLIKLEGQVVVNEEYGLIIDRLKAQNFELLKSVDYRETRKLKLELSSLRKEFDKFKKACDLSQFVEKIISDSYESAVETKKPAKKWWQIFKK